MALTFATVTSTSPLMVQEDGASSAVYATRDSAYASPTIGDRVVVEPIRPSGGHGAIIYVHGKPI